MQTNTKVAFCKATLVLKPTKKPCGGDRTRTRYLLLAKQPLSQLSYTPKIPTRKTLEDNGGSGWSRTNDPRLIKTVL